MHEAKPFVFPPRLILSNEDDGDGSDDSGSGGSDSEFLILGDGKYFVRKSAIEGMRWDPEYDGEEKGWKLLVYFSFAEWHITLRGSDASDLLGQYGLPSEPPGE